MSHRKPRQPSHLDAAHAVPVLLFLLIANVLGASEATAQEGLDQAFQGRLENGEFSLALTEAMELDDDEEKDQVLARIAQHQAAAGAKQAAVRTVLQVRSDVLQSQTLHQVLDTGMPNPGGAAGGMGPANPGGGSLADFDSLIELITTTVSPETWEEIGGTGTIAGFPTGVLIDTTGLMRPVPRLGESRLGEIRRSVDDRDMVRVSLPRLEAAAMARQAMGLPPTDDMLTLGGMDRVRYVFVDRDAHDVVLVGPRSANPDSLSRGRLSDLTVALHQTFRGDGRMVCSITPRSRNLAATQEYLLESNSRPLRPGQRQSWLDNLQAKMGRQDIEFQGLDADTHTAHVLVAADYHMKLIGMGLREGVPGVVSYLDTVEVQPDGSIPPMEVLRWWFTLTKQPVSTDEDRMVFELPRSSVRVQSENEMLEEQGVRVHTGRSDPRNRRFSESFSLHFDELAGLYPIYRELRDVFDFSVIAVLLVDEELPETIGWHPTLLASMDPYLVPRLAIPTEVETIVNHRVLEKRHIVAGVSGGVDLAVRRDLPAIRTRAGRSYEFNSVYRESKGTDRHASYENTVGWTW